MGIGRMSYIISSMTGDQKISKGTKIDFDNYENACLQASSLSITHVFCGVLNEKDGMPLIYFRKGEFAGYGPNVLTGQEVSLPLDSDITLYSTQDDKENDGASMLCKIQINRDRIEISSTKAPAIFASIQVWEKQWRVFYSDPYKDETDRIVMIDDLKTAIEDFKFIRG